MCKAKLRSLAPLLACCLAIAPALAGCGSSSDASLVKFQGSSASISKATLAHWMQVKVDSDYFSSLAKPAPAGLVSEPADYSECSAVASKIVPHDSAGKLELTASQIEQKCRQLHQVVKEQALESLITAQWTAIEAAKAGVSVSTAALHNDFVRYRNQDMPTEAQLRRFLEQRHSSVSDILFERREGLLEKGLGPKVEAEVARAGGGEAGYVKVVQARYLAHVAKTSCKAGYVVPHCKEYREPAGGPLAANVILEAFAHGRVSSRTPYTG